MKSACILQLAITALLAAAQPGLHRRHTDLHRLKRGNTVMHTEIHVVEEIVVIEVDSQGKSIGQSMSTRTRTELATAAAATTSLASVAAAPQEKHVVNGPPFDHPPSYGSKPSTTEVPDTPTTTAPVAPQYTTQTSPPQTASAAPVSTASSGGSTSSGSSSGFSIPAGKAVVYSPSKSGGDKCRPNVAGDLAVLVSQYSVIRIYSATNCDALELGLKASRAAGGRTKFFVTPTDQDISKRQASMDGLASYVGDNWDLIFALGVSNEAGATEAENVALSVTKYKNMYSQHGLAVVAVEHNGQMTTTVSSVSDFCALNIHAYYDKTISASGAAQFVQGQLDLEEANCSGKPMLVTESGWPSQGYCSASFRTFDATQQESAIASLKTLPNTFLFMAWNDDTKEAGFEQFFGFMDTD